MLGLPICTRALLDDLICLQQEGLRNRLLDEEIGGFGAFQDPVPSLRMGRDVDLRQRANEAEAYRINTQSMTIGIVSAPTRVWQSGPCGSRGSQHPAEPDDPEEITANRRRRHRASLRPAPTTQPEVRALDEAIQSR